MYGLCLLHPPVAFSGADCYDLSVSCLVRWQVLSWLSRQGLFPIEYIVHVDPDFFKRIMPEVCVVVISMYDECAICVSCVHDMYMSLYICKFEYKYLYIYIYEVCRYA